MLLGHRRQAACCRSLMVTQRFSVRSRRSRSGLRSWSSVRTSEIFTASETFAWVKDSGWIHDVLRASLPDGHRERVVALEVAIANERPRTTGIRGRDRCTVADACVV